MYKNSNIVKFICMVLLSSCIYVQGHAQNSPYIHKVYEFTPAPGQFVNTLPVYEEGDTPEMIAAKCTEAIAGESGELISLGGYGGYIVFGFDHRIENRSGHYDFKVLGNAFYAASNPNPDAADREGGSSEPGIVMVSRDDNGNGLPDDEWYELAGSEYDAPETIHSYTITYQRSDETKEPVKDPSNPAFTDVTYCPWTDNQGGSGFVFRNSFHKQSYWPQWIDADELTFTGTKLADNAVDESGKGSYYVLYCYGYGYADNQPNNDPRNRCSFNIEWAVSADGHHVWLDGIDFVKVYTGVNQYSGWLGETSTEICGALDLHLTGDDAEDEYFTSGVHPILLPENSGEEIFTPGGVKTTCANVPGIYIIKTKSGVKKVVKK